MLIQHLRRREVKVLLRDMHSPLPQRIHPRLRAHTLQLRARTPIHLLRNLCQIDPPREIHAPGMNPQDIRPRLHRRGRELDFTINAARPQQGRVEDVEPVGRHDDFDVLRGLEAVELVQQLEHRALDFAVAATGPFHARGADAVDLVHEDDARRVLPRHHE